MLKYATGATLVTLLTRAVFTRRHGTIHLFNYSVIMHLFRSVLVLVILSLNGVELGKSYMKYKI